jgi:hypothetical protein
MGLDGNRPSPPLIPQLALLHCLPWLVGVTVADAPIAGVPIAIVTGQLSIHPVSMLAWACFFVMMPALLASWRRTSSPSHAVIIELQEQFLG